MQPPAFEAKQVISPIPQTIFLHRHPPLTLAAMKHWPPLSPRALARRIPAFHPVPVTPRYDGWTPERQAAFIGSLAQTRSVIAAARAVGMGRESAYRLRRRAGAAGFAAAWDAALGRPHTPVDLASTKSTGIDPAIRAASGLMVVVMHRGRFVATRRKPDDSALLQHLAQLDRAACAGDPGGQKSQVSKP